MLTISTLTVKLVGTRPLLICRGEAANPFDNQANALKQVSQKRGKSQEDHLLVSKLQFAANAYHDDELGFYLPSANVFKCLQEGAARFKETEKVKTLITVLGEKDPAGSTILPNGKVNLEKGYELFADKRMCGLGTGKQKKLILVTRPIFPAGWSATFKLDYTDLEADRILEYLNLAGSVKGIGAYRPVHGLFRVERIR